MSNYPRQSIDIDEVATYRQDVEDALRLYYGSAASNPRFIGYSITELNNELDARLAELELSSTLILLSCVEAAFQIDYRLRCYRGPIDNLSTAFRRLNKRSKKRVNLDPNILDAWKKQTNVSTALLGELKAAFKLRHWIAHGRYWDAKVSRKYDFFSLHSFTSSIVNVFPFFTSL